MTTTNSKKFCVDGGFLVGAETDYVRMGRPSDSQIAQNTDIIGCSTLICSVCEKLVLSEPSLMPKKAAKLPIVYDEWIKKGGPPRDLLARRKQTGRLYMCSCAAWWETSYTATQPPGAKDLHDVSFTWHCSGHQKLTSASAASLLAETETLLSAPASQLPNPTDKLRRLWNISEEQLRVQLWGVLRRVLTCSNSKAQELARALALAELTPTRLAADIANIAPNDYRLAMNDPTRAGWKLSDRLSSTIANCVEGGTLEWSSIQSTAIELLSNTQSKKLMALAFRKAPDLAYELAIERMTSTTSERHVLADETLRWSVILDKLLNRNMSVIPHHAGKYLQDRTSSSSDRQAARLGAARALDRVLELWKPKECDPAYNAQLLQVLEVMQPRAAFSRLLVVAETSTEPTERKNALLALSAYYPAPPQGPDPAFEDFVLLARQATAEPKLTRYAIRILVQVDRLDFTNDDQLMGVIQMESHLAEVVKATLERETTRRPTVTLTRLFNACLANDPRYPGDRRFREAVQTAGGKIDYTAREAGPVVYWENKSFRLRVANSNLQLYWGLSFDVDNEEVLDDIVLSFPQAPA